MQRNHQYKLEREWRRARKAAGTSSGSVLTPLRPRSLLVREVKDKKRKIARGLVRREWLNRQLSQALEDFLKFSSTPDTSPSPSPSPAPLPEGVKSTREILREELTASTVEHLQRMAKQSGLTGYSRLRKAALVELVMTAMP